MHNQLPSIMILLVLLFSISLTCASDIVNTSKEHSISCTSSTANHSNKKNFQTESQSENTGISVSFLEVIVGSLAVILAILTITFSYTGFLAKKLFDNTEKKVSDIYDTHALTKSMLREVELHLSKLDNTDALTKAKIDASQKTLIQCLTKISDRNIAFSTYSKLLKAYEVLLHNGGEEYKTVEFEEKMTMAATLIQGNNEYVPEETLEFMIECQNFPFSVKQILLGDK